MAIGRKMSTEDKIKKWEALESLQEAFPYSIEGLLLFAQTVINMLIVGNPSLNRVQADMLKFLFSGNLYRMIMAQRGQAKTTLTAIYCAFMLIHKPNYRIVIFSQNGKRAKEIAGWVVKIYYSLEFLDFMLPDTYAGDRASVEAFEVHWVLRGADKSPSVACYSIESGAQGARADIILADDIESLQNSRTVAGREWLVEQTKEFESINQYGDIIYLGTPQTGSSIYYGLPARGYQLRIWTGRYPTDDEIKLYNDWIAPMLLDDIAQDSSVQGGGGLTGKRGKPTSPEMYDEEALCKKELSQGDAKFNLQFMLNTGLLDEDRHPLKLSNLIVASFDHDKAPVMPLYAKSKATLWETAPRIGNKRADKLYFAMNVSYKYRKFDRILMAIDPSGGGQNGDEMAYAVVGQLGAVVYLLAVGGVRGGYAEEDLLTLVETAKLFQVGEVFIEKNYGNGAHMSALAPHFQKKYPVTLTEENATGQKEVRIIDTIEPILNSHRLVITQQVAQNDILSVQKYPASKRMRYSFLHQMSHITRDKDSLGHDDRVDAVALAIWQLTKSIDYDQHALEAKRKAREEQRWKEIMEDKYSFKEYMQNNCNLELSYGKRSSGRNMFHKKPGNSPKQTKRFRRR